MTALTKRATVYFDPGLHKAIKLKAVANSVTVSDIVNRAIKLTLSEDAEDLAAFNERKNEPLISFEKVLADLKERGKI